MLSENTQAVTKCGALKIAAYGLLFLFIIPFLLIIWARRLDVLIPNPPTGGSPNIGAVLMFVGFVIMAAGWHAIIRTGNGLPMNIAPPRKLVTTGIYSILSHPIYLGFTMLCAGYFLLTALPAGFWIVTPCVALGCTALVWGYERHDLQARFGTATWPKAIHFLQADGVIPNVVDRVTAYGWMLVLWFAAYHGLSAFYASTAVGGQSLLDLSVANWVQLVYLALYLGILIAPGIARRKRTLRSFPRIGLLGTIAILFPFPLASSGPQRPRRVCSGQLAGFQSA